MSYFLSCDWGTSSLRLKLVNIENLQVLAEVNSDKGISTTYSLWQSSGNPGMEDRITFYLHILREYKEELEKSSNLNLDNIPIVISGMASSSIGMKEIPYRWLPFKTDGSGARVEHFEGMENFNNPVLLLSGVKSGDDVMRGEETQLIGAVTECEDVKGEKIFIFPGTHSKHIFVRGDEVVDFKTYMTGEFFELLSEKSILKEGVEKHYDFEDTTIQKSFNKGARHATGFNLLNAAFRVRTNALFDKISKKENYSYLSGLLIGTELKEINNQDAAHIYLCCTSDLKFWYEQALLALNLAGTVTIFPARSVEMAVIKGQLKIYNRFKGLQ